MNTDLLVVAVLAGLANYAFRVFPTRMGSTALPQTGPLARFLAATGPAAIATLFVASILPALSFVPRDMAILAIGCDKKDDPSPEPNHKIDFEAERQ